MCTFRFHKLLVEGNNYSVTHKKPFSAMVDLSKYVEKALSFAYKMTFEKVGEQRDHRSGGIEHRDLSQQFQNTFQGKLAEFGVYDYVKNHHFAINEPDLGVYESGVWDDVDLTVKDHRISVKSGAFFSQLLLLEANDWDENGFYIPNVQDESDCYDFFVFCRIKPDIKTVFSQKNFENDYSLPKIKEVIAQNKWEMDIPGYITRDNLMYLIKEKYIIPQRAILNGRKEMDADNYYCQAGDLWKVDGIFDIVNGTIPEDFLKQGHAK